MQPKALSAQLDLQLALILSPLQAAEDEQMRKPELALEKEQQSAKLGDKMRMP